MNLLRNLWEKFYPVTFGMLSGYAIWLYLSTRTIPEKCYDMMANGITIGGIIVGFLATTVALIYSLQDNYIVKQLKKMGHFPTFVGFFKAAVNWCMILAGLGAFGFFLDFTDPKLIDYHRIFLSCWVGIFVTAGLCAYRFIRVLCVLLHQETEE